MVVVCKKKKKKPHPAWVFLKKMPEKQLILFVWPYHGIARINIGIFIRGVGEEGEVRKKRWGGVLLASIYK